MTNIAAAHGFGGICILTLGSSIINSYVGSTSFYNQPVRQLPIIYGARYGVRHKYMAGGAELGSKLMFLAKNQRQIKKMTDI